MKIQTLNYLAFGPFTDKKLDFSRAGLHIVYGPNEAGKSAALRGLKALFYGFDTRTQDNFKHANNQLRIGASLASDDGQTLAFVRRKGRINTLLDTTQSPLESNALRPYLRDVSPELFSSLFGIDHAALVRGGQDILEQKGNAGQVLFSAALGSQALHGALAQLDEDANALFKPQGSISTINSSLKRFAELKKQIASHSLSSALWETHQERLTQTVFALDRVSLTLASYRKDINRLKRILRVAPKLSQRQKILQDLSEPGEVLVLPDDFSKRRQKTVQALQNAQSLLNQYQPRQDQYQAQLDDIEIDQILLEQAETIENLHARLGAYRQLQQDQPEKKEKHQQLLNQAQNLLFEVRPDLELVDISTLQQVLINRQDLTELGRESAVLESKLEHAQKNYRDSELAHSFGIKKLDQCPQRRGMDTLSRAIFEARKLGDIDRDLQTVKRDFNAESRQCDQALKRLALWAGDRHALPVLAVPSRESIVHFETVFDAHEKRQQRLLERQQASDDELAEVMQQLDQIRSAGDVPSEQTLIEARADRDTLWQILRQKWIDGIDVSSQLKAFGVKGALHDIFEDRLKLSDAVSDRLRRESDRVHTIASLQARRSALQQKQSDFTSQHMVIEKQRAQLETEWSALWLAAEIQPRTPREMFAWLSEMEKLRKRVEQLNDLEHTLSEFKQTRKKHVDRLQKQLTAYDRDHQNSKLLEPLLIESEALVQRTDQSNQRRDGLEEKLGEFEQKLHQARAEKEIAGTAMENWQQQWVKLIAKSGIQKGTKPAQADDFIEKVRVIQAKLNEAEQLKISLKMMDAEIVALGRDVQSVTKSMGPEFSNLSIEDKVIHLNTSLTQNRANQTRHHALKKNVDDLELEIGNSKSAIQTMQDRLGALRAEAKCEDDQALDLVEAASGKYLELKDQLETVEREILALGEGSSLSTLEHEVKGVEMDELPARIKALSDEITSTLEPEQSKLQQAKGREEKELELMNGGDQAAQLAEEAQSVLADIRSNSERYIRAKLAGRILRDEIERHRAEHQGPIMTRASEHFSALTLGSFTGLISDFNAKDEPILAGVRPEGDKVYVEGMSAGTRDQLYLALRLASLEEYLENAETMPFIVDDILVEFDDQRSKAALESLATLAEKTQVILFTHHAHIAEQAGQLSGVAQVHQLSTCANAT